MPLTTLNIESHTVTDLVDKVNEIITVSLANTAIWTSANDGPGSGLDADTLDGQHKNYFIANSSNVITSTHIISDAITTAKILNYNVTTAKIANSAITTVKITDSNVTTDKIADSNVTTAKLANNAVTYAKMQTVTNARMLGNNSGSTAVPSEMTQANVRSFLGLGSAAYNANTAFATAVSPTMTGTVDTTGADIKNQTLTDGATVNWNMTSGQVATITLGGNRTIAAPTNLKIQTYILHVIQDATGSRTLTWNSVFKWVAGAAPVLTTTANARDVFVFICDGTNLYGSYLPDVK